LTTDVVSLENTTEFLQWHIGLFVNDQTTDDEKHALSTRC